MTIAEELNSRGLIHQCSNELVFRNLKSTVYCGFDPTSDSLTVGNLLALVTLKRFQKAGWRVIPLIGVATAMIGDPSGRNAERPHLDRGEIRRNAISIQRQIEKILGVKPEWNSHFFEGSVPVPEFFRSVCSCFSVNEMMRRDSVKNRIDSGGMTFAELGYMVFQAFDFLKLFETEGCQVQIGGSDQWGNICSGLDLIKSKHPDAEAIGVTFPLLLKSDGTKFGKSSDGAVWLSAEKTSPWEFFNFWINQSDEDIELLMFKFSNRGMGEIADLVTDHNQFRSARNAQRTLAEEMTEMVHGKKEAERCKRIASAMFDSEWDKLTTEDFEEVAKVVGGLTVPVDLVDVVDLLVRTGLAESKSEARRLISGGGVRMSGGVIKESPCLLPKRLYRNQFFVLQKGKKDFRIISVDLFSSQVVG